MIYTIKKDHLDLIESISIFDVSSTWFLHSVGVLEDALLTEIVDFAAEEDAIGSHGNGRQPQPTRVLARLVAGHQRPPAPLAGQGAVLAHLLLFPVPVSTINSSYYSSSSSSPLQKMIGTTFQWLSIIIRAICDLLNPKFIHFPNFYQNLGLKGQKLWKFVKKMDILSK